MRTDRKVMRRVVLVAAASAALFMGATPAQADNGPHVSTATNNTTFVDGQPTNGVKISDAGQGRCASCHRAHTAKAPYLLNATSEEALCFSCHGTGGTGATTDVQGGVGYDTASSTTYPDGTTVQTVVRGATQVLPLRGGGFEKAMLGSSEATKDMGVLGAHGWTSVNQLIPPAPTQEATTSSHLGGVNVMWGNGALSATPNTGKVMSSPKLECTSCHDPHGNKQYRILRPVPSDSGFSATDFPDGILIPDTTNKVYTTDNYWSVGDTNVPAEELTTTILGATSIVDPTPKIKTSSVAVSPYMANVAAWCTTCHTRYLAPSQSYKTDSGDAVFTYRHTGDNVSGDKDARSRNCIQCHVAHGSNAVMPNSSVEWPDGTTPSSDSRLLRVDDRGICVMCHNV